MTRITRVFSHLTVAAFAVSAVLLSTSATEAQPVSIQDPENTLIIEVGLGYSSDSADAQPANTGTVVVELLEDVAPKHAERLKTLARQGFYNGVKFHRVIEDFMAQTGDPTGTGRGGSEMADLPQEFSDLPFERGVVGMARTQDPNSANSQFFIMFDRVPSLDTQYTVLGRVISGMEVVDSIKKGSRRANGVVEGARDRMVSVKVAAD